MMITEEFLESIGVWTKRSSSEVLPLLLPQILSNYNLKVNKYFTAGSIYMIVSRRVRIVVKGIYRMLRTRIDIFVNQRHSRNILSANATSFIAANRQPTPHRGSRKRKASDNHYCIVSGGKYIIVDVPVIYSVRGKTIDYRTHWSYFHLDPNDFS